MLLQAACNLFSLAFSFSYQRSYLSGRMDGAAQSLSNAGILEQTI
jgi:hypothetical protein